jgi:hypothetical protein
MVKLDDAGQMGVSDETDQRPAGRERVDRLGELHEVLEPLRRRQRPVDQGEWPFDGRERKPPQDVQLGETEPLSSPDDRSLGHFVEPVEIQLAEARQVVVARHHDGPQGAEAFQARDGVRAVAKGIAQAQVAVDALGGEGIQDGGERFEVAVDVRENRVPHVWVGAFAR